MCIIIGGSNIGDFPIKLQIAKVYSSPIFQYNIMAESKFVQSNFENNSHIVCTVYNFYVFSMLSLGCISISDLVNLFMHSLSTLLGYILFYIKGVMQYTGAVVNC